MSFATLKELAASKKIITLELDIPLLPEDNIDMLLNSEPGIWFIELWPDPVLTFDAGAIVWEDDPNEFQDSDIGSVKVNGVDYTRAEDMATLRIQSESFYYDIVSTKLYIHFLDSEQPYGEWAVSRILIGQTTGYCDKIDSENKAYFGGVYFEPRILSVPSISKSKDPLFFGVLKFQGGSVTLKNEGYFDRFSDLNIVRQPARLKMGFDGLAYDEYWQGPGYYVESYSRNFLEFILKLQDVRKSLSMPVPPNVLTLADWPNLNPDNVNKPKPILYGTRRGIPMICLNEMDTGAAVFQFLVMDTEFHDVTAVSTVYVNGEALTAGQWSLNASAGVITINDEYCEDSLTDVTCDATGANISNSLLVVRDLMLNYGNVQFIPTNYDIKEWNLATADAQAVGLYLDEQTELINAIEPCCVASDILFFSKDGGQYTARRYDENRAPRTTPIGADEWLDEPQIDCDWTKFLSSALVNYDEDLTTRKKRSYLNTVYEAEVFTRYKSKQTKSFDTILSSEAGAQAKSETIMSLSKVIGEIVKRTTKTQNIDLELMDFIVASPTTRVGETEQLGVYEIIGITKNLTPSTVALTMRYVKPYVEPEEIEYQQGYLWGERIFGEMLHSVTEY
jgi:hypothetical protein